MWPRLSLVSPRLEHPANHSIIVSTTAPPGGGAVLGALPLSHAIAAQSGDALDASRDLAGLHVVKYGVAGDLVTTALAGGGGEGAMALDQLLLAYSGIRLNVVDVLRIVGQELALVLQHGDEGVGGGELLVILRKYILRNRIEDRRVLSEYIDVEDLLGIVDVKS